MSEETTLTPATEGSDAASNYGGENKSPRSLLDPSSAILREKEGDARPKKGRRRKVSYLTLNKIDHVDYKEVAILKRFISERGKILSTRQTGNTAKQQRMIARAIRRAREMALIPFVMMEIGAERAPRRPRTDRPDRGDRQDRNNDNGE